MSTVRLKKQGIDFFMYPTQTDPRISLIEKIHGHTGHYVVTKLMQLTYGEQGYFLTWNHRLMKMYCADWRVEQKAFEAILDECLDEQLFDKDMLEQHGVLTSAEIQENFFSVIHRRKNIRYEKKYLLVDVAAILKQEADDSEIEESTSPVKAGKSTENQTSKKSAHVDMHTENVDMNEEHVDMIELSADTNPISATIFTTRKEASEAKQEEASEAKQVSFHNSVPEFSFREKDEAGLDWKKINESFNQERTEKEVFTHDEAPQTKGVREKSHKPPSANKPSGKKAKNTKKPHPVRPKVIAIWEQKFGQVYTNNFEGNRGIGHIIRSLENLIKRIEPALTEEIVCEKIADLWNIILSQWEKTEPYLRKQIQFEHIGKNIANIINQVKVNDSATKNTGNRSNVKPSYSSAKSLLRASLS